MSTLVGYRYSHTIGKFAGAGGHGFNNPADAVLSVIGSVYVLSRSSSIEGGSRRRVTVCTIDGDYVREFSEGGTDDGMLASPVSIASDADGNVYVSDEQESASIEKLFWGPAAVKVDGQGRVYVVDSCRHRIQVYVKGG